MPCIHYKFRNAKEYDTITFDTLQITLADLKKAIMNQKRMGKSTESTLVVTNAQTEEEYKDETTMIPKNTSVVVKRVPMTNPRAASRSEKSGDGRDKISIALPVRTLVLECSSSLPGVIDHVAITVFSPVLVQRMENSSDRSAPKKIADPLNSPDTEMEKIKDMMKQSSEVYNATQHSQRSTMRSNRDLPPNYLCYRCGQPGHHISKCPTNGDSRYDVNRLKRPTGIPKSFLQVVDKSDGVTVMTSAGQFAISSSSEKVASKNEWDGKPVVQVRREVNKKEVPPELLCGICNRLCVDAVVIPCCGASFCDDCIRNHLLENDDHSCPICKSQNISPDTLVINQSVRKSIAKFVADKYSSAVIEQRQVMLDQEIDNSKLETIKTEKSVQPPDSKPLSNSKQQSETAHRNDTVASGDRIKSFGKPISTKVKGRTNAVTDVAAKSEKVKRQQEPSRTFLQTEPRRSTPIPDPPQNPPIMTIINDPTFERIPNMGSHLRFPRPPPVSAPNVYGGIQHTFNVAPQEIFPSNAPQSYVPRPPIQLVRQNILQPMEFNHPTPPPPFLNKLPMITPEATMMNMQVPPPIFNPSPMPNVPMSQPNISTGFEQFTPMINENTISHDDYSRKNFRDAEGSRKYSRKRERKNRSFSRSISRSPSAQKRRKRDSSRDSYSSSRSSESHRRRRRSRSNSRSRQRFKNRLSPRRGKRTSNKSSRETRSPRRVIRKSHSSGSNLKSRHESRTRKPDSDRHKRLRSPIPIRNRSEDLRSRIEKKSLKSSSQSKKGEKIVNKKDSKEKKKTKSRSKVEKPNRKSSNKVHKKKKRKHKHRKESSMSPVIAPDSTAALSGDEQSEGSMNSAKVSNTSPTVGLESVHETESDSTIKPPKIELITFDENVVIDSHKLNETTTVPDLTDKSKCQVEEKQSSTSIIKTENSIPTITTKRPRLIRRKDFR
ncbi:E3 ubiquitin-protein ligase RBBP6 [Trichoplax sp. H2]|nr:E3 ubiquitin-protein ligase RBBP6 [Trichoplax sp. H2]|eukprot:RDD42076.1 E3 ubiquitin-protein ligase RBBP6 [Trichoplax sp. H2]